MTCRSILRLSTLAAAIALSGSVLAMQATHSTKPQGPDVMTLSRTLPEEMPLASGNVVAVDPANGHGAYIVTRIANSN